MIYIIQGVVIPYDKMRLQLEPLKFHSSIRIRTSTTAKYYPIRAFVMETQWYGREIRAIPIDV